MTDYSVKKTLHGSVGQKPFTGDRRRLIIAVWLTAKTKERQ
ncbi:hypothetical protein [Tenebrionicola larvae]|nr:hypothetical protein [Tenebrionicola larvae]